MGRTKKSVVVGEEATVPRVPKSEPYLISATFTVKDQEGNKVRLKYHGTGSDVPAALADLKDEDSNPFPKTGFFS